VDSAQGTGCRPWAAAHKKTSRRRQLVSLLFKVTGSRSGNLAGRPAMPEWSAPSSRTSKRREAGDIWFQLRRGTTRICTTVFHADPTTAATKATDRHPGTIPAPRDRVAENTLQWLTTGGRHGRRGDVSGARGEVPACS